MEKELEKMLKRLKARVRIQKVVCTRSVKGKNGDHYVGFSAAWDTTQDDMGGAPDTMTALPETEEKIAQTQGLTLKEAKVAALLLGMQADIAAHNHAMAGGSISVSDRDTAIQGIKFNYSRLIAELVSVGNGEDK